MRRYTKKFVLEKMGRRLHDAVCPFPGKYPLRLLAVNGETVYHGKFTASIWKYFWKQRTLNIDAQLFLIYDKAGAVITSSSMSRLIFMSNTILYRYFASTQVNGSALLAVVPTQIGPYHLYLGDSATQILATRPLDRPRWLHYINSNVAHIRTM
jgi:hypothetical protein